MKLLLSLISLILCLASIVNSSSLLSFTRNYSFFQLSGETGDYIANATLNQFLQAAYVIDYNPTTTDVSLLAIGPSSSTYYLTSYNIKANTFSTLSTPVNNELTFEMDNNGYQLYKNVFYIVGELVNDTSISVMTVDFNSFESQMFNYPVTDYQESNVPSSAIVGDILYVGYYGIDNNPYIQEYQLPLKTSKDGGAGKLYKFSSSIGALANAEGTLFATQGSSPALYYIAMFYSNLTICQVDVESLACPVVYSKEMSYVGEFFPYYFNQNNNYLTLLEIQDYADSSNSGSINGNAPVLYTIVDISTFTVVETFTSPNIYQNYNNNDDDFFYYDNSN